ncbi:Phage minor capsid protein 2 [Lentzea xinjiangensis]|uniref:Phage minor capsid protein 2 n=1 Tax=Lentzea xinjiangensis TaxID=402600 RepID=A0A1H9TDS2_9PSEU|nr:phage minor capsid protein [Lentzea xinjiangensis]SER95395.1 Phage minor capsid protein 2 [Lentzea xinjiangensis]
MKGVNPADASRVLKTLVDVWDTAAERMLLTVARRLARGIDEPGWAEQKSREALAVSGELRGIMRQVPTEETAVAALQEAYALGERAAESLGERFVASNPSKVIRLATLFARKLRGTYVPVTRAHEDVFQRAVTESELLMQTGTMVRREAVASTVDRLLTEGVDRFAAGDGKRWHLDAYVRMAGRTVAQHTMIEGQLDGMVARGKDLVVISDSVRECRLCRPWESKLLSISGSSVGAEVDGLVVVGSVAEARAAGLWHPNCTHRADPYVSGLTRVPEPRENPEGYEQQQKLRRLEREVRQLKRTLLAVQQLGDTQAARDLRRKIRVKSEQIAAHTEASGLNRRRERERLVGG